MPPRYDADHDAKQCAVRNDTVCPACQNRVAFIGKRGAKGAWNKPCQGPIKPDPTGSGRLRSSYGGKKIGLPDLNTTEPEEPELRPHTPEPEYEPRLQHPCSVAEPALQAEVETFDPQADTDEAQMDMSL